MKIFYNLRSTRNLEKSQQEWFEALNYAATSVRHFEPQNPLNNTQQTEKEKVFTMSPSLLNELAAKYETKGKAKGRTEEKIIKIKQKEKSKK
ncbi:MAG: hypothetical protein LBE12_13440 [Planctomycetaceae bacterium]|jgi:ATP phosphoribosyltransferase regulatory subunit HisZ|nr:hypothetical protein [Planctomycetaceae bacterium]